MKKHNLDKLKLNKSEVIYITDVNEEAQTFFGQLTRFSNEELKNFGVKVHSSIEELFKKDGPVKKVSRDQMVGARFSDGNWYRAFVADKSNTTKMAMVTFIDWGNSELISYSNIVANIDTLDLNREPFGVTCKYINIEEAKEDQIKKLFDTFSNRYLLIKPKEEICGVWQVDLPMVAYNAHFWKAVNANWQLIPTNQSYDPFRDYMETQNQLLDTAVKCQ